MKNGKIEEAFEQFIQPIIEKCISKALEENNESTIKDPEQWLTMGKACKEFGCTLNTLRQAMIKQELPYYQPENRTYLKRKEVFRYLESVKIKSKNDVEEYSFLRQK
jgi:Rieske Fe-S protein